MILALVRDLIFASRITATASSSGVELKLVRDPTKLQDEVGTRVLVDLNLPGAIEAAQQWKQLHGGELIGFVSHTDAATIDRARAAGFDRVLARSAFVEMLPQLLQDVT
jgi:hypothetical protein